MILIEEKRLSHTLVAGAICVAGAIAPDWFEYVLKLGNQHIEHQGPAHVFRYWLLVALAFTLV